ncbi:hypothetical protein [Nocardia sp. NPDC003354]
MSIESEDRGDELEPQPRLDTREGFALRVRRLFEQLPLSTNQFERRHGLADSTVSKFQTGKNVPSVKFILALLEEAKVNAVLNDAVAEQYWQDYGALLQRLDDNGRGHNTHRLMYANFKGETEAARARQELLDIAEEKQRLEVEAADESTPDERKAVLRVQAQQLAARQAAAIEHRDAVLRELAEVVEESRRHGLSDEAPRYAPPPSGLPGGHAPQALGSHDTAAGLPGGHAPQAPAGLAPASGAPGSPAPRSRSLASLLTAAVVVLALGGFAIYRLTAQDDSGANAAPGGAAQTPSAEPPSQSAETTPSVSPTPSPSAEQSEPLAIGDLNFTGNSWVQGTWTIDEREYPASLAWEKPCATNQEVVIALPKPYKQLTAVVGMDHENVQNANRDVLATFTVWADRDGDGISDLDEEVASRGVTWDKSATIEAPLHGVEQVILGIDTNYCSGTPTLVWGSPKVR